MIPSKRKKLKKTLTAKKIDKNPFFEKKIVKDIKNKKVKYDVKI